MAARGTAEISAQSSAGTELRGEAGGEIQALLESPELRRIFDEPATLHGGRFATTSRFGRTSSGRSAEPVGGAAQPAKSSGNRRMRLAVGLAPIYLGLFILVVEIARQPSLLPNLFGSSSVAEETSHRNPNSDLRAMAAGGVSAENPSAIADASTERLATVRVPPETGADHILGRNAFAPMVSKEMVSREKAASDLAKQGGGRAAGGEERSEVEVAASADISGPGGEPDPADTGLASLQYSGIAPVPDPRAPLVPKAEAPIDPAAAEAAEAVLGLSRTDRREVQRRLRFAKFDPQFIDGIFGPATRAAIAGWQDAAGLPPTGYVDDVAIALLVDQTAEDYRAWRSTEGARARREAEAESMVVASSAQPRRAAPRPNRCQRLSSGEIAFGKKVSCNFQAFSENFKSDFRDLKGSLRDLFD